MTGRSADAEDLAQDAFIRAYRALGRYRPNAIRALRPRGWLAAIVRERGPESCAPARGPERTPLDDAVAIRRPSRGPGRSARRAARGGASLAGTAGPLPARYRRGGRASPRRGPELPGARGGPGSPIGTVKSDVHRGVRLLRDA